MSAAPRRGAAARRLAGAATGHPGERGRRRSLLRLGRRRDEAEPRFVLPPAFSPTVTAMARKAAPAPVGERPAGRPPVRAATAPAAPKSAPAPVQRSGAAATREEVLARLAERGLVRTRPAGEERPCLDDDWPHDGATQPAERPWYLAPGQLLAREAAVVLARGNSADRSGRPASHARTLVAGAFAAVTLLGALIVAASGTTAEDRDRTVCTRFDAVRSQLTNGTIGGAELTAALAEIRKQAADASPTIADASTQLAQAGTPGTSGFLIASTGLSDACEAAVG